MEQISAISILCEGTMRAAVHHLVDVKGLDASKVSPSDLAHALSVTIKVEMDSVLREWQAAVDAHMNEAWLRKFLNTQCNDLALKALRFGKWID